MTNPQLSRAFAGDLSIRSDGRTIAGLCAPFDTPAKVSDDGRRSYVEVFQRGAFAKTIAGGGTVKLLVSHNSRALPIGRATSLREDARGLVGEFRVSKTTAGDEALELIKDGAVDAFSVGFSPVSHANRDGAVHRTEVRLREVSVVSFPAYETALIEAVRSADHPSLSLARQRLALARIRIESMR